MLHFGLRMTVLAAIFGGEDRVGARSFGRDHA